MGWLIAGGIVSFIFGLLLLFSGVILQKWGEVLNRVIIVINGILSPIRIPVGFVLVIIGGWLIWVAFTYPDLWYLHVLGWLALVIGMLYLFIPGWLDALSKFCNQVVLATDELIMATRVLVGIVLILAALYMFYAAYLAR